MPFAVQLTIDDVIRDRKRQERQAAREERQRQRERRSATAGKPLFDPLPSQEDPEVTHG